MHSPSSQSDPGPSGSQLYSLLELCVKKINELETLLNDLQRLITRLESRCGPEIDLSKSNVVASELPPRDDQKINYQYVHSLEEELLSSRHEIDLLFQQIHELSAFIQVQSMPTEAARPSIFKRLFTKIKSKALQLIDDRS